MDSNACCGRHGPTKRWTGVTGSVFRIKLDPVKLLGSAVARSTQPLGIFAMDALECLIHDATSGRINRADAESFCAAENIELADLCNRIALIVAERFDNRTLSYQDGDGVMNAIFGVLVDGKKPMDSVEPAWSIYLAFDEGEYYHGGDADPVESFTRPQIRHILNDAQQIVGREPR